MREKKKSVATNRQSFVMKPSKERKLMDDDHQALRTEFEDEMITDILIRLPVQSLLRFKCVSKFWKTLISEPYFKKKHQIHAMNSKKLVVGQLSIDTYRLYCFYSFSLSSVQLAENAKRLACPTNYEPTCYELHCSCNGLVLVSIGPHLLLWNPSTRESIQLPHSEGSTYFNTCGFGYDTTSDDYKIVKFSTSPNYNMEILQLKSGFWRKINCESDLLPMAHNISNDTFAFLHGAFHWIGFQQKELFVVSLSISDEVYGKIQLLEPMKVSNFPDTHGIIVLRGMLCFYYAHSPFSGTTCKLWIMKEYGVEESWIQLYTIREAGLRLERVIHMFDDDEVLLIYGRNGEGDYPFRTSKGPFKLWPECNAIRRGITYTESMISPKLLI